MSLSSSPPYADPLVILVEKNINHPDSNAIPIPPQTRLHHFCDDFFQFIKLSILSFAIIAFVSLRIYEIILACYNCRLENTNLGYIRASFFLNIPFLIGVFIYFIIMLKKSDWCRSKTNVKHERCDRCIFIITGQWKKFTDFIFQRHKREIVIEQIKY